MLRLTFRLTTRKFSRRTANLCDSRWFRLAIVVLLTCLLLPTPRVQAKPVATLPGAPNASTKTPG